MNDEQIERALAMSELKVDTEDALLRFRARAANEQIVPVVVPLRRRAPTRRVRPRKSRPPTASSSR